MTDCSAMAPSTETSTTTSCTTIATTQSSSHPPVVNIWKLRMEQQNQLLAQKKLEEQKKLLEERKLKQQASQKNQKKTILSESTTNSPVEDGFVKVTNKKKNTEPQPSSSNTNIGQAKKKKNTKSLPLSGDAVVAVVDGSNKENSIELEQQPSAQQEQSCAIVNVQTHSENVLAKDVLSSPKTPLDKPDVWPSLSNDSSPVANSSQTSTVWSTKTDPAPKQQQRAIQSGKNTTKSNINMSRSSSLEGKPAETETPSKTPRVRSQSSAAVTATQSLETANNAHMTGSHRAPHNNRSGSSQKSGSNNFGRHGTNAQNYNARHHSYNSSFTRTQQHQQFGMMPVGQPVYAFYPSLVFKTPQLQQAETEVQSLYYFIKTQIEYYFSIENLCRDLFIRQQMHTQHGGVPLTLIASFNRVKSLLSSIKTKMVALMPPNSNKTIDSISDKDVIQAALMISDIIELFSAKDVWFVRLKHGWDYWVLPTSSQEKTTTEQETAEPFRPGPFQSEGQSETHAQ